MVDDYTRLLEKVNSKLQVLQALVSLDPNLKGGVSEILYPLDRVTPEALKALLDADIDAQTLVEVIRSIEKISLMSNTVAKKSSRL